MYCTMHQRDNIFYTVLQERPHRQSRKEHHVSHPITRKIGTDDMLNMEGRRRIGIGEESEEGIDTEHAPVHEKGETVEREDDGCEGDIDYPVLEGSFSVWQEVESCDELPCHDMFCDEDQCGIS